MRDGREQRAEESDSLKTGPSVPVLHMAQHCRNSKQACAASAHHHRGWTGSGGGAASQGGRHASNARIGLGSTHPNRCRMRPGRGYPAAQV